MLSDLASPAWLGVALKRRCGPPADIARPELLTSIVESMLTSMSDEARMALRERLEERARRRDGPLVFSMACWGTDVCFSAAQALTSSLPKILHVDEEALRFERGFSCESDGLKQQFLQKVQGAQTAFTEIANLGNTMSTNSVTEQEEIIGKMDIFAVTLSCKDMSNLKKSGLADKSSSPGSSGGAFQGVLSICEAHQPKLVIMENAAASSDADGEVVDKNWAHISQSFDSIGYTVHRKFLDASHYGFPQSRGRVFLCAVRVEHPRTPESVLKDFDHAYAGIAGIEPTPLKDFFLSGEQVQMWNETSSKRCKEGAGESAGAAAAWASTHASLFCEKKLHWPPSTDEAHAARYADPSQPLSAREAEVLILNEKCHPLDPDCSDEEVLDLSQDIRRVKIFKNKTCCLTAGVVLWLRRERRRLRGEEMLRLQGFWPQGRTRLLTFSDVLLKDLAANAVNAGAFLACLLAALQVVEFSSS